MNEQNKKTDSKKPENTSLEELGLIKYSNLYNCISDYNKRIKEYHQKLELYVYGLLLAIDKKEQTKKTGTFPRLSKTNQQTLSNLNSKGIEEKNEGYQFIFRQATIILYSYLEAAIKDIVISYFNLYDDPTNLEEIKENKV